MLISSENVVSPFQEEGDGEDDWNPCKATGVCLSLFAHCCEDDIVDAVLPFIQENIQLPDWRRREAAVMAFGSIIEVKRPPYKSCVEV